VVVVVLAQFELPPPDFVLPDFWPVLFLLLCPTVWTPDEGPDPEPVKPDVDGLEFDELFGELCCPVVVLKLWFGDVAGSTVPSGDFELW
jgi:hypothetical protein